MNKFTKSGLAMALQVMAVVLLFGYPGCSSNTVSKEISTPKTSVVSDSSVTLKTEIKKISGSHPLGLLLKQEEAK